MINPNQIKQFFTGIFKKNPIIFLMIKFTLWLIIFLIFYLIEKIIFIILTIITFTKILAIPIQIILHLLLIRHIIIQVAFIGQNIVVFRSTLLNLGINQANPFYINLKSVHDSLSSLNNNIRGLVSNISEFSDIKNRIGRIQAFINYTLDIYTRMKNKFNTLTIDQEIFNNNILTLNDSINNGQLLSFINSAIDILKKYNKKKLSDLPDDEKNKIISELSNPNLNIPKILMICHKLMAQIEDYIGEKYNSYNTRYIRNYFKNNLFASIEQFHCELSDYFCFEEKTLITKDKCKLEYIIIRNNFNYPKKKLMIICGPNGIPFQIFARNFRFAHYLESNIDVLFWNYRGYGLSEGIPSYSKLRTDVLELFDEVKKNNNYQKYAVHGISIGGIPCCHLASNRKDIELMVCDRNFGRLDNITQSFYFGKYLFYLYKLLLFQSTDNVDNYLDSKSYKIILNDPQDTIVLETCSLKTLIAQKLCENYFDCIHEDKNNISNDTSETSHYNELEVLSNKISINDSQNIHLNINDQIITKNNKNNKSKQLIKKTVLDKILNSVEEKNKFVNILINVSNIFENDKLESNSNENCLKNYINKFTNKTMQYENLKEEELQNTNGIFDFVKNHILNIFRSIESAGDTLFSIVNIKTNYTKEVFIDNFFNNMFIWGSQCNENDIHSSKNITKIFEECMKLFEEFWNSEEIISYKGLTLIKDIDILYKYFLKIQNNLKYVGLNTKHGFVKLINEELNDNNNCNYEQCLIQFNIGNFVPLHCGHNGIITGEEEILLEKYLEKSSFFNDDKNENNSLEEYKNDEDNDDINTCFVANK